MSASLRAAPRLPVVLSGLARTFLLIAPWTVVFSRALAQNEATRKETTLSDKLGLEGPLDNDTARACNDAATRELAKADPTRLPDALEAARRALVASAPGDAVCLDPRRSVGVEIAVRRFLAANTAAFAQRFEGLARAALDEAGNDERALERIEHENPFTKSGVSASLRMFDLAFERGERAAASTALERARLGALAVPDALVDAAIAARRAALGADTPASDEGAAIDRAHVLVLASMVDYGVDASEDPAWHLQPSAAFGDRAWIQSAESLITIDSLSHATVVYPRDLLAPFRASWNLAFGEEGQPWLQRPALDDTGKHLALVLGRTKEKRGNALTVLDLSGAGPRALWVHAESGFAHADGARASEADALLAGRLEFQPGPVCFEGLVIAQVLQWLQPGLSPADQHVETAATIDWLVAFDIESGRAVWKQRIASGADRRARTASRFANERGLSCACLPLALQSGEVFVATELGIVARCDAASGALHETWRMRRARPATGSTLGFGGPLAVPPADGRPGFFALQSADSGGVAYVDEGHVEGADHASPSIYAIEHGERLVSASAKNLVALVRTHERLVLQTFGRADADATLEAASVPLPRGAAWKGSVAGSQAILCVLDGRAVLYDLRRDLAIRAIVELPGLDGEGAAGLLVHDDTAYVLGTRRAWVLRLQ